MYCEEMFLGGEFHSPLFSAVLECNTPEVSRLLEEGADPNETSTGKKWTVLHLITNLQRDTETLLELAEMMLLHGADPLIQDTYRRTPLHCAFWDKKTALTAMLLQRLPRGVNPIDCRDLSAFHIACAQGDDDRVRDLLDCGAQVHHYVTKSFRTYAGFNALHFASYFNRQSTVELLLERGAEVNKATAYGQTALHLSCICQDPTAVSVLIDKGADLEAVDGKGLTPLLYTCCSDPIFGSLLGEDVEIIYINGLLDIDIEQMYNSRKSIIQYLLDRGASVNACHPEDKRTILHLLCEFGKAEFAPVIVDIAELLIHHGAEVNARDENLKTPLHYASARENYQFYIDVLLAHGADVNAQDYKLQTPLHSAALMGNELRVNVLLEHGADVNLRTINGKTPISITYIRQPPNKRHAKLNNFYTPVLSVLFRHVQRLLVLGLPVDEEIADDFKERQIRGAVFSIEIQCLDELKRMRLLQVDSDTTLYRLLKTGRDSLNQCLDDERLESIMEEFEIPEKYPNYYYILRSQVKRARWMKTAEVVMRAIAQCSLPLLCTEGVFKYLTDADLKNVAAVTKLKRESSEPPSDEPSAKKSRPSDPND